MAGIQITGLASGLNWQNLITELVAADRAPETQWKAEQTTNSTQIGSLSTLNTDLLAFQSAAEDLSIGTTFSARTATVGDPSSGWTASASPNTTAGQYAFNVKQLASTSILTGAANGAAPLGTTSDVSGVTIGTMNVATPVTAGVFTVDGKQISVASSDSLQDVLNRIDTVTGNVTAAYNPNTDQIDLTSSSPITLGAANDTSNFLSATSLYSNNGTLSSDGKTYAVASSNALGSVSLSSTIADSGLATAITSVDSSGNGTFSVNNVSFDFNVNTDSLTSILNQINASTAGVTATFNSATSQFTLTNNSTGNSDITVSESGNGLLGAMGLTSGTTYTAGKNAQFSVNGSNYFDSATNNLDASVDGIAGLTVNATSTGPQTVTVGNDTSGISTAVNNLVSAYNTIQTYITAQTQITTSSTGAVTTNPLSGNQDILNMQSSLQALMFNSISGMTGSVKSLGDMGLGFTGTSPLMSIQDQGTFDNAIQNNTDQVNQMLTGYPNGIVAQINDFVINATGPDSVISTQTSALNQDNTNLTTQTTNLEAQLTAEQQQLTSEFTAMESAESEYQNELSTLNSVLNTGSSSSSSSSSNNSFSTMSNAMANASTSASSSSS